MKDFLNIADISEKQLHIQMTPISKKLKAANDVLIQQEVEQKNRHRTLRWKAGLWSKSRVVKGVSPYSFDVEIAEQENVLPMMVEL